MYCDLSITRVNRRVCAATHNCAFAYTQRTTKNASDLTFLELAFMVDVVIVRAMVLRIDEKSRRLVTVCHEQIID